MGPEPPPSTAGVGAGGPGAGLPGEGPPAEGPGPGVDILVPSVVVHPLLVHCVEQCLRVSPGARIVVLLDTEPSPDERARLPAGVEVLVTGPVSISAKRNLGARATRNPYLAFVDSDAYPADGWTANAIAVLEQRADVLLVGGPNVSFPDPSPWERRVGAAQRSRLISGMNHYRKFVAPARYCRHLPACNLVLRRRDFEALGGMNPRVTVGEDLELCHRIRRAGGRIYYTPDVLVFHKDRRLGAFFLQRLTYGARAWRVLAETRSVEHVYFFVPLLCLAFLVSGPLWLARPGGRTLYLLGAGLYLGGIAVETVRLADRASDWPGVFVALLVGNLAPGLGMILEPLRVLPGNHRIYRNYD